MIIEKKGIENISNQNTVDFELDNSNGQLFSVLSELYSKPEESTLRELATNCTDAHIMSGNQHRPFIIKLPNKNKNIYNFSVRDFGPGLNHNQILSIYKVYGKSTKTDSNEQTGCLGLGSKSPFAISSTFYVKSYKDGLCSQYTCSMGNNGIPQITEEPVTFDTYEENGLEVIVPIYKEINFQQIIKNTLKHFKVKPLVYIQNGALDVDTWVDIKWETFEERIKITDTISIKKEYLNLSNLIKFLNSYPSAGSNEVIQLQIYYPIDKKIIMDTIERFNKVFTNEENEIINNFKIDKNIIKSIEYLFLMGFELHSKPGAIAFAPSRETIKYNELTLIYIIKELIYAARILNKMVETRLKRMKTYEDVFDLVYLGNNEINLITKYFNVLCKKNILSDSTKVFDKTIYPKQFLSANDSTHFEKGLHGSYNFYPEKYISLNSEKKSFFPENKKTHYIDIWDTSKLNFNYSLNVLTFSLPTPFTRLFIQSMYKKILYWLWNDLGQAYLKGLEEFCFKTNDKIFTEYCFEKNSSFSLAFDSYEEKILEPLRNSARPLEEIKKELYDHYINEFNKNTVSEFDNFINRSSFSPAEFSEVKKIKNLLRDIVSRFSSYKNFNEIFGIDKVSIVNCINESTSIPLIDFDSRFLETYCAKTFNKLLRSKDKYKKNFMPKLLEAELKILPNFSENFYSYSNSNSSNNILPFESLYNEKGSASKLMVFISQVIMYFYFKLYPEEIEKQINKSDELKDIEVKEWLKEIKIPEKYMDRFEQLGRWKPERKTNNQSLLPIDSGNTLCESKLYYYDFEINEELFELLKNKIKEKFDLIERTFILLNKIYIKFKENNIKGFILHPRKIFNQIKIDYKLEDIINNLNSKNIFERYNNYISLIRTLSELNRDLFIYIDPQLNLKRRFVEFGGDEYAELYPEIDKKIKNINIYNSGKQINIFAVEINNKIYLNIPNYLLKNLNSTNSKNLFIYDKDLNVNISLEKKEIYYSKFLSENEICNLSDFKIGSGKNYICGIEEIDNILDIKRNEKILSDGKTKKIRFEFLDGFSFSSLSAFGSYLKIFYPNITFINDKDFPTKYKKDCINMLSLITKLPYNPIFIKYNFFINDMFNLKSNNGLVVYPRLGANIQHTFHSKLKDLDTQINKIFPLLTNSDQYKILMENFKIINSINPKLEKQYKNYLKEYIRHFSNETRNYIYYQNPTFFDTNFKNFKNNGITIEELVNFFSNNVNVNLLFTQSLNLNYHDSLQNNIRNQKTIRIFNNLIFSLLDQESNNISEQIIRVLHEDLSDKKFIEFKKANVGFINIMQDLDSLLERNFNTRCLDIGEIENIIYAYLKPRVPAKNIRFINEIGLLEDLKRIQDKKILHYKINRR